MAPAERFEPAPPQGKPLEEESRARQNYDAPAVQGVGPSRGSTPPNNEPGAGPSIRQPNGRGARSDTAEQMRSLPSNNRPLRPGRAGRYSNTSDHPHPLTDNWPRDALNRPTGGRIRGLTKQVLDNVRGPGTRNTPAREDTEVTPAARGKVENLKNRYVKRDGKCEALQASHLVAGSLGGFGDDARNLVAMSGADNRRMYQEFEKGAAATVRANPNGQFVYFVRPVYSGSSQYPSQMQATLQLTGGTMADGSTQFGVSRAFIPRDAAYVTSSC